MSDDDMVTLEVRMTEKEVRNWAKSLAAAPGPLRELGYELRTETWDDWLDALADAVGEP
jgi:hypothetical protein